MSSPGGLGTTQGALIVRDAPPSFSSLYYPGKQVGVLRAHQKIEILAREDIWDLFTSQQWLFVRGTDGEDPIVGWVYNGQLADDIWYIQPEKNAPGVETGSSQPTE